MSEVFVMSVVFRDDKDGEQIIGVYDNEKLAKAQSEVFWERLQNLKDAPLSLEEGEDFDEAYEEYLSDKELMESMLCTRIISYELNQELC